MPIPTIMTARPDDGKAVWPDYGRPLRQVTVISGRIKNRVTVPDKTWRYTIKAHQGVDAYLYA
jgi:hypothetical protein